jgi:hypothetical protein
MKCRAKVKVPVIEKKVELIMEGLMPLLNAYPFATADAAEALNRLQALQPEGEPRIRTELFFRAIADTMDAVHKSGQVLQRA